LKSTKTEQHGRVRIIGGLWKRRIIRFRGSSELRPTPDSVRETLFNWLAASVQGATCADLFAGSGALGIEAASRGAARVVLVESQQRTWRQLKEIITTLQAQHIVAEHHEALDWLGQCTLKLDLVFIDPPYGSGLLDRAIHRLIRSQSLNPGAQIYIEHRVDEKPQIPSNWILRKQKTTGQVRYSLYQADEALAATSADLL